MADIDQTIAAQVRVPTPPDVVGPISSLAQMQYWAAQGQKLTAETQAVQAGLAAKQRAVSAIQGGTAPEEAINSSGLGVFDPQGASATLANVSAGNTIKANRAYAAANPGSPLAIAGPEAVAAGFKPAQAGADVQKAQLANSDVQTQLYGKIGTMMASDPSPAGRAQTVAFAKSINAPPDLIAKFATLPDDQYVAAGQHFQAASMNPDKYMEVSGQAEQNKGLAQASTTIQKVGPGESIVAGPGASAVMAGKPAPSFAASPGPSPAGGPFVPNNSGPPIATDAQGRAIDPKTGQPTQPAAASPAWASQDGQGSPGLSNNPLNNPGNIRDGAFAQSQPGYVGAKNGFAIFQSPMLGQAAMEKNLLAYGRKGIDTPAAIAATWAPAGDGKNDPAAYANFVAGRLGIGPNDKIDLNDAAARKALAVAMSQQENGPAGSRGTMIAGRAAAAPAAVSPAIAAAGAIPAPPALQGGPQPPQTAQPPLQAPAAAAIQPAAFVAPPPAPAAAAPAAAPPSAPLIPAGSSTPTAAAAVTQPNGGLQTIASGMSKSALAEQEAQGKAYGDLPGQLDKDASGAKDLITNIEEMQQHVGTWQMGKWADNEENAREAGQSVAHFFGLNTPDWDQKIADYQSFNKLAANLPRAAAKELGTRTGIQELNLLGKSFPGTGTSEPGFDIIAPQLKGLADFKVAKQSAASQWRAANGNSVGPMAQSGGKDFQTIWNENASPTAFVVHRMAQENPQALQAALTRMKTLPGGKAAFDNIIKQTTWAHDAGLLQ